MKINVYEGSLLMLVLALIILIFLQGQNNTLIIKNIPTGTVPINETELTSLVTSTDKSGDKSIIHLANGLTVIDYNSTLQSGDSIRLSGLILKPVCSLYMQSGNNETIKNNTVVKIQTIEDPKCQEGNNIFQLQGWQKINQK